MNFIISSSALLRNLQSISGVLNSSNSLPILDNFLFELADGKLTISASDLENTMKTVVTPDEGKKDGRVAIPAKLLLDTLKNFADQPLAFQINENFGIEISSDYGKYKLVGQNADDFPRSLDMGDVEVLKITGEIIANAIENTLFASGNDDLRPVMSGVFCQFSSEKLIFVATDAHKLVKYGRLDSTATKSADFILPKKPLNLLRQNLGGGEEEVEVSYNETTAKFVFGTIELTCRLIDGKYPNYDAVIPKLNPNVLTVDRLSFLNSIKRVSIFSNKTTHQVKLKIAGSELTISAEDLDFSNEAKERLTCSYAGDDLEIGFNSKFLLEMLNHIKTQEVILEMSEPNKAGILLPSEASNDNEEILMLVMPVMIR